MRWAARGAHVQFSLATRTMILRQQTTSVRTVLLPRVVFTHHAKIVRVFSNISRTVVFDFRIFGVISMVQRAWARCTSHQLAPPIRD